MATAEQCTRCDKSGLSILLVRPTAIANDAALAPPEAAKLQTHPASVAALALPSLKQSRYALRLLREGGFVYVYYPQGRPAKLKTPWEAYKVCQQGALLPEGQFTHETANFACSRRSTHPHDVRTVCIEKPEEVGAVWIGFSMNWWSQRIKARAAQDPAAAGMVKVDLNAAAQASGFKAEAEAISAHVADYALADLRHARVDSATPFYPAKAGESASVALAMVMRQQAAASPHTRDKEQVLAIPDPVGLAADLNGIRMAKDKALKEALANSTDARSLSCDATLHGLEAVIRAAAQARAQSEAYGRTSLKDWNRIKDMPYLQGSGLTWQASPDGAKAADGSTDGRLVDPQDTRRAGAIDRRGQHLAERDWQKISSQIDQDRRTQMVEKANARIRHDAQQLAPYEEDWLARAVSDETVQYFDVHFDEDAPNKLTDPVSSGLAYARESKLVHYPQALSTQEICERYQAHLLDKRITDKQAVALRAMFGNQKGIIEKVDAMLLGDADRGNEDNMRDKTYDVLKGLLTSELGARYAWLTPAFAALSGSHYLAMGAAGFMALRGDPQRYGTYLRKLPRLTLAHNSVLFAIDTAVQKRELNMPILIEREMSAQEVLARISSAPKDQYSRADRQAIAKQRRPIRVLELSDVNTETAALRRRSDAPVFAPGQGDKSKAGKAMATLKQNAKSIGPVIMTEGDVTRLQRVRAIDAANLAAKARVGQWMGGGAMVVQAIGLFQAGPQLMAALKGPDGDKLREAALSVADGVSGFAGALADTSASAHKAMLLENSAGRQLVALSTRLVMLETAAAVAGMAGGALNAVMMGYKAGAARDQGDVSSAAAFYLSAFAFWGTAATSTLAAANAASEGAAARAVARHILLRGTALITAEVLAQSAAAVVAGIATAGWVLLLVGTGAAIYGALMSRTELQRWAGRCWFGNGDDAEPSRFATAIEEDAALDLILMPASPLDATHVTA